MKEPNKNNPTKTTQMTTNDKIQNIVSLKAILEYNTE